MSAGGTLAASKAGVRRAGVAPAGIRGLSGVMSRNYATGRPRTAVTHARPSCHAGGPLPEAVKAYRWLSERYEPVIAAIPVRYRDRLDDAQLIYEFIEHRNALSRAAGRQIENPETLVTFVNDVLEALPKEKAIIDSEDDADPYDAFLRRTGETRSA